MSTRKASGPRHSATTRAKTSKARGDTSRGRKSRTSGKDRSSPADNAALEAGRQAYMARDFDRARDIWQPLADAGNAEAQAWIGSLYANGDGVEADAGAAFAWYLKSAEGKNVPAQSNVGAMYAMGQGVEKDMAEALRWMRRAAKGGDTHAQFNLAVLYGKGDGVPQNHAKAAEWYRKAAESGHYPSQARLGHMYVSGEGVKRDRVQAFLWLSLAGQHGIGSALSALEAVVKDMSADEKAEGLGLVSHWRGKTGETEMLINPVPG